MKFHSLHTEIVSAEVGPLGGSPVGNPVWAIFVASVLFPEDGVHHGNQLSTRVAATKQWPAKVVTERTIMATSLISNLYTERS